MKVVLFCGGQGMRLRDVSHDMPKPLVNIGNRPILWHLMKYYAHHGHTEFILCLGYKGEMIKEYFLNYKEWVSNDFSLRDGGRKVDMVRSDIDDWTIHFVETGLQACIGERLLAVRKHVQDEAYFLANYSDGLSDLPLNDYIRDAMEGGRAATFMATRPNQSFHLVRFDEAEERASWGRPPRREATPLRRVRRIEDVKQAGLWINAGFFVLGQDVFDYMRPREDLVHQPFSRMVEADELRAHRHDGFWRGMDTFKDHADLETMHREGGAPWRVWDRPCKEASLIADPVGAPSIQSLRHAAALV